MFVGWMKRNISGYAHGVVVSVEEIACLFRQLESPSLKIYDDAIPPDFLWQPAQSTT